MSPDKSGENVSVSLPPELAKVYRDEANRCYNGDLSAALSAAVEHWALSTLRAHGVAAMPPFGAESAPAGPGRAFPAGPDGDWDLTDPHMD